MRERAVHAPPVMGMQMQSRRRAQYRKASELVAKEGGGYPPHYRNSSGLDFTAAQSEPKIRKNNSEDYNVGAPMAQQPMYLRHARYLHFLFFTHRHWCPGHSAPALLLNLFCVVLRAHDAAWTGTDGTDVAHTSWSRYTSQAGEESTLHDPLP